MCRDRILNGVTLQNNTARLSGGAIYCATGMSWAGEYVPPPSLEMSECIVQNNQVLGEKQQYYPGRGGAVAEGGGVCMWSGTASLSNVLFSATTARGGEGGPAGWVTDPWRGERYRVSAGKGGDALGGGMRVERAAVTLRDCTFESNSAVGGIGGTHTASIGQGYGGGLYVRADGFGTAASLDDFTVGHLINNTANVGPDIYGPYTVSH